MEMSGNNHLNVLGLVLSVPFLVAMVFANTGIGVL
jgi:hypothetical protein